jgi:hypothetical protein
MASGLQSSKSVLENQWGTAEKQTHLEIVVWNQGDSVQMFRSSLIASS